MEKQWYEKKKKEGLHDLEIAINFTCKLIEEDKELQSIDKDYLTQKVIKCQDSEPDDFKWLINDIKKINHNGNYIEGVYPEIWGFEAIRNVKCMLSGIKRLLDSEWINIKGDIVITDPCYTTNDWGKGFVTDILPLYRDTIYGDWSCTTYNKDTNEVIGRFCADSGMVCVDTLEEILKRKPDFMEAYGEWYRTIIKNFEGKVRFNIVCIDDINELKKFDIWHYEVEVEGVGINTLTGEKIRFYTTQTGL